jgi:hypothetical protein
MPRNLKLALLAAMFLLATANAATVAVLEITSANDEMDLTPNETKFLTDELRRQAMRILPKSYSVLTREKIIALIPSTVENFNSVIDIGMVIKSDYVTRGSIGKLGNLFTLTVELYETSSGNMLEDFVKESTDLKGLLDAIRESAPGLFSKLMPKEELPAAPAPEIAKPEIAIDTPSVATAAEIPTNIPSEPKKDKTSFWVAIGLDVLGATAIGLGIYNNSKSNTYYNESQNILGDKSLDNQAKRKAFDDKYKKMQDTETMRNIFYATGGALLLGGIAVHIWF